MGGAGGRICGGGCGSGGRIIGGAGRACGGWRICGSVGRPNEDGCWRTCGGGIGLG